MITWQIGRAKLGQFEICWEFQHGMCYGVPFPRANPGAAALWNGTRKNTSGKAALPPCI